MTRYIPRKVPTYLVRLTAEYESDDAVAEALRVVKSGRSFVVPDVEYDSLDGGTYGHQVRLYLPLDILKTFSIKRQEKIADRIRDDLNTLARNVPNEFISGVQIEMDDESDPDFQAAVALSGRPEIDPAALDFWQPGLVRLFISHRDGHKAKVHELAEALKAFGISSFVAHEQIAPAKEWRKEIMNGLRTMEIMLIFLTDDFDESCWTNQEVGYALGANVPIISLKLETRDPPGFVSHSQALRGTLSEPAKSSRLLFKLIAEQVGALDRLADALIASFITSDSFYDTKDRFERMRSVITKLSFAQTMTIIDGFSKNYSLHNATYLTSHYNRLTS